jgi:cell division control protein 6
MVEHLRVATKPDLLYENYHPASIIGRELQIREISLCLEPALQKVKPLHAWLYGESGTGKTLVARHILKKLQGEAYIDGIYCTNW